MESKEEKSPLPEKTQKTQPISLPKSKKGKTFVFLVAFLITSFAYVILEQKKVIQSLKSEISRPDKTLVPRPPPIKIDIAKPDALIITKSFSQLPSDLIQHSFIKDLIDKSVFNFYQNNASLLGLRGAIKRISFEQNTTVLDKLLKFAFNKPAEIAFWKGHTGQLEYFMLVFKNSGTLGLSEKLTWLAEKDDRLNYIGHRLFGINKISTYELKYTGSRTVFISFSDDNIFYVLGCVSSQIFLINSETKKSKKMTEGFLEN